MKNAQLSRGRKKSLGKRIIAAKLNYLFMAPYALIFITFTIIPVAMAIGYGFTQFNGLEPAKFIGIENYHRLFVRDPLFMKALLNTLMFAAILGPGGYLLSLTFAWCINDIKRGYRTVLTLFFYAPSLCGPYAIWKVIFSGDYYGIANSIVMRLGISYEPIQWLQDEAYINVVVIIILLWASMGTSFLSFIAGFQNIDPGLYEAGAIDGIRNRWQELWFITLPSMKPQLMFGAVMSIASSFGIGDQIAALVGFPSPNYVSHTIVAHIQDYSSVRFEMGYACAIAVVLFAIMIIANKGVQRLLRRVGS